MNASFKCSLSLACLLGTGAVVADPMSGGRFELVGVMTSGSFRLAGGNYGMFGVADFGVHSPMAGGSYQVSDGVLDGVDESQAIDLAYEVLEEGSLRLSWPATAQRFSLEVTSELEIPTSWRPIPASSFDGNSYVAPKPSSALFFRLRSL